MGRSRPRGRRARNDDSGAANAPKADRDSSAEKEIVDALLRLGRQLRDVPVGPSDSFRGNLRERLTSSPGSPSTPRSDRPRPPRP